MANTRARSPSLSDIDGLPSELIICITEANREQSPEYEETKGNLHLVESGASLRHRLHPR